MYGFAGRLMAMQSLWEVRWEKRTRLPAALCC
jgi:hypothetical protein